MSNDRKSRKPSNERVRVDVDFGQVRIACRTCNGDKWVSPSFPVRYKQECPSCSGTGETKVFRHEIQFGDRILPKI